MRILSALCIFLFAFSAWSVPKNSITGTDLLNGKEITVGLENKLDPKDNKKGLVVVFLSAKCPCSNSHVEEIESLSKEYPDFGFVAVHSNKDEDLAKSKDYFLTKKISFPVIQDQDTKIADEFDAKSTPHAFIVLANGKLAFKGGVSDRSKFSESRRKYLREALNDLHNNREVKTPDARTLGCAISRGGFFE